MYYSGQAMSGIVENLAVSPTLLRVVRVFRVGRILRLVKSAKGIRTLLFSEIIYLSICFFISLSYERISGLYSSRKLFIYLFVFYFFII